MHTPHSREGHSVRCIEVLLSGSDSSRLNADSGIFILDNYDFLKHVQPYLVLVDLLDVRLCVRLGVRLVVV